MTRMLSAVALALVVGCDAMTLTTISGGPIPVEVPGDSDGDGWMDGEEQDLGSGPDWRFSWDFGGERWPDFRDEAKDAGLEGEGYDVGDVMPDFIGIDQYGNKVRLSTFYGYVILIDFTAGWCEPCQLVAADAQTMWEDHRLDGFLIIHALVDDETNDDVVDPGFQAVWAEAHGIEFPVLLDDERGAYTGLATSGLYAGEIPFMVLLDKKMRIDSVYTGQGEELQAEERAMEIFPRN